MYDKILVRSSLTTNIWENDGRRRNVIATIPIVAGEGNGGIIEYVPPGGEVRTYSIKDSLASAKNFKINFTDELNQPIVFNSPYELTIAIFFCSGESSVNMY